MGSVAEKIQAELENIDEIFAEIPHYSQLPKLSTLELAGLAALVQNFYNGIENIIKQIFIAKTIPVPKGEAWHRKLLNIAKENGLISAECKISLSAYLAFRHFFNHGYALDLEFEKMEPLIENMQEVYLLFKNEIKNLL